MSSASRRAPGLIIVAVVIFAIGGLLTVFGIKGIFDAVGTADWPVAEGTIVQSEISKRKLDQPLKYEYSPSVRYEYVVDGENYRNSTIRPGGRRSSRIKTEAEYRLAPYPKGQKDKVYYNPDNPGKSLLEPGMNFAVLMYPAFGIVALFVGRVFWRQAQRRQKPTPS